MKWKLSFIGVVIGLVIILAIIKIYQKEKIFYSTSYTFDEMIWERPNIVTLEVLVDPTMLNKPYNIDLQVEHTFQVRKDMTLIDIEMMAPEGEERLSTHKIWFKNSDGKFRGTAHENLLHLQQNLRKEFLFSQEGVWKFAIQQRSEYQYLQGVKSVQLTIYPSAEPKENNKE